MVRIRRGGRLAVLVAGVAAVGMAGVVAAVGTAVQATTTKPDFTVIATPASRTVELGGSATFTLTVMQQRGFTGVVAVTASGPHTGVTVTPPTASLALTKTATSTSSTVTVAAGPTAAPGTYPVTLTGTSGSLSHTAAVRVTISKPPGGKGSLTLTATPASAVMAPGNTASYAIAIARAGASGAVTLAATGLPPGATATFSANPVTGSTSTLSVSTTSATPQGRFPLTVTGRRGNLAATATLSLVIEKPGMPFTIGGPRAPIVALAPGVTAPLNLAITNPNASELRITNLTVTVVSTTKAACAAAANYTLSQFSGGYPMTIPAGATATLQQLGILSSFWPRLTMPDLPTNQDACRGATINLSYSGKGNGGVTS